MKIHDIIDTLLKFVSTTKVDIKMEPNDVNILVKRKEAQLKVEYKDKAKDNND